jgi:hypothetical protein
MMSEIKHNPKPGCSAPRVEAVSGLCVSISGTRTQSVVIDRTTRKNGKVVSIDVHERKVASRHGFRFTAQNKKHQTEYSTLDETYETDVVTLTRFSNSSSVHTLRN